MLPNVRILQRAAVIGNQRQLPRPMWAALSNNHLIGVRVDDEIGVVRHNDDLSSMLSVAVAPIVVSLDRRRYDVSEDKWTLY